MHGGYKVDTRSVHGGYSYIARRIHGVYTADTRSIHGRYTVDTWWIYRFAPAWWGGAPGKRVNAPCIEYVSRMYRVCIEYVWKMYRLLGDANTAPATAIGNPGVAASQLTPNDGRGLAPPLLQRSATAARGPIHASCTNRSAAVSEAEPAAPAPTGGQCHHASRRGPGPAPAGSDGCRRLQSARALR